MKTENQQSQKATDSQNVSILDVTKPLTGLGHAPRVNAGIGRNGTEAKWARRAALKSAALLEACGTGVRVWTYAFTVPLTCEEIRALAPRVRLLRAAADKHRRQMDAAKVDRHDTSENYLRNLCFPENFTDEVSRTSGEPVKRLAGVKGVFLTAVFFRSTAVWHLMLSYPRIPGEFVASGATLAAICADFRAARNTAAVSHGTRTRRNGPHRIAENESHDYRIESISTAMHRRAVGICEFPRFPLQP